MYRQINIFDFIEKPPESEQRPPKTQFEQLFEKAREPVFLCVNCLCRYCADNAEGDIKPGEMREPCFNCDECREYSGNHKCKVRCLEECSKFVMSDVHGAGRQHCHERGGSWHYPGRKSKP